MESTLSSRNLEKILRRPMVSRSEDTKKREKKKRLDRRGKVHYVIRTSTVSFSDSKNFVLLLLSRGIKH